MKTIKQQFNSSSSSPSSSTSEKQTVSHSLSYTYPSTTPDSPSPKPHIILCLQGVSSISPPSPPVSENDISKTPQAYLGLGDLLYAFLGGIASSSINANGHCMFVESLERMYGVGRVDLREVGGVVYGLVESVDGLVVYVKGCSRGGSNKPRMIAVYAPDEVKRLRRASKALSYGGEETFWRKLRWKGANRVYVKGVSGRVGREIGELEVLKAGGVDCIRRLEMDVWKLEDRGEKFWLRRVRSELKRAREWWAGGDLDREIQVREAELERLLVQGHDDVRSASMLIPKGYNMLTFTYPVFEGDDGGWCYGPFDRSDLQFRHSGIGVGDIPKRMRGWVGAIGRIEADCTMREVGRRVYASMIESGLGSLHPAIELHGFGAVHPFGSYHATPDMHIMFSRWGSRPDGTAVRVELDVDALQRVHTEAVRRTIEVCYWLGREWIRRSPKLDRRQKCCREWVGRMEMSMRQLEDDGLEGDCTKVEPCDSPLAVLAYIRRTPMKGVTHVGWRESEGCVKVFGDSETAGLDQFEFLHRLGGEAGDTTSLRCRKYGLHNLKGDRRIVAMRDFVEAVDCAMYLFVKSMIRRLAA